jgi:putative oxidoreductase
MFMELLFKTTGDPVLTMLRVVLGTVVLAHGAQKLLGWFGGQGLKATLHFFVEVMKIPTPLAILAIATEFFGGMGLVVGFLSRIAAAGVVVVMVVAILGVHWHHGFFMNWFGSQEGEGFEYHLLAIALASAIVFEGAGAFSVDLAIYQKSVEEYDHIIQPLLGSRDGKVSVRAPRLSDTETRGSRIQTDADSPPKRVLQPHAAPTKVARGLYIAAVDNALRTPGHLFEPEYETRNPLDFLELPGVG